MSNPDRPGRGCADKLLATLFLGSVLFGCGTRPEKGSVPVGKPTATTVGIPGGCPSGIGAAAQEPRQASQCLYDAWVRGDRASAAVFASLDVVAVVFQTPWTAPRGVFLGCTADVDAGQRCSVEHHGTAYQYEVRRSEGGWRVTQVQMPTVR